MADRKSTRSRLAKRSSGHEIRTHPSAKRRRATSAGHNAAPNLPILSDKALAELRHVSMRLKIARAVCVTVDQALRNQNAESDVDIADTVRWALSYHIDDDIERLDTFVARANGKAPGRSK